MPTVSNKKKTLGAPEQPPAQTTDEGDGAGAPTIQPKEFDVIVRSRSDARPMMTPPAESVEEQIVASGVSAWYNAKKITAMWSNSSVRNSFAAVDGLGWKRLSNANDSSWVALTALASHAEQVNASCNVRIESDGEVHELYVW